MYNETAIKFSYFDGSETQIVNFSSDEYLTAVRVQDMPVLEQTSQKNVVTQYLPTTLFAFTFNIQFKIKTRETYSKIESLLGKQVDMYPYFGDVGSVIDLLEINYTELDYFDKNSFTGVLKPTFSVTSFKSLKTRNGIAEMTFKGFYRKVPEGVIDIVLSLREFALLSYHSTHAITSATRGVSPDDQYTGRVVATGHDIADDTFVQIQNMTSTSWNGVWPVRTRVSSTVFTIGLPNSATTPATVGSGSLTRLSYAVYSKAEVRWIVKDLTLGVYPLELYIRNFAGREQSGQYNWNSYGSWKNDINGISQVVNAYVPYNTSTLEGATSGIGSPVELTLLSDFDYTDTDTTVWKKLATGSLTPTQYGEWTNYLNSIGVST